MNKIITISREYGAGGHSIGKRVAEELGIPFYDRDILKETVKASGFDSDLVETEQEDVSRTESFFKSLCNVSSLYYNDTQTAISMSSRQSFSILRRKVPVSFWAAAPTRSCAKPVSKA